MFKVKLLNNDAKTPIKGSRFSAGLDLFSSEDFKIDPWDRRLISTGISIELPEGTYGRIAPRSGLAVKNGIQVGAGVIDRDYRGEIKVLLFNLSNEEFQGKKGDRIAQLILEKIEEVKAPDIVTVLSDSDRADKGFGSSGQ